MKPKTILVIDDSLVVLQALSMKLRSRGYRVVTAADSSTGISLMRQEKPDLLILDVNFPTDSWDGFGLMTWFRRMEESRELPIVVISGSDEGNYEQRCREAGAVGFFLKPLDYELLLAALRQALHQTPEEQALVALPVVDSPPLRPSQVERPELVLLVEDDKSLRETLELFLQSEGFRVTSVPDGSEGLRQVIATEFHITLSDMVMPNMPGDQFYKEVERVKPHLCRRFIFMTGHQADPRSDAFIRRVHSFMLWKPFPLCDLLTAINVVWKKSQSGPVPSPGLSAKPPLSLAMAAR
ncbi:MAG TPA: response regulator [Verrucomicrobiae bacterium]|nr:response regulator [Verrucomicrobiae bacterium]